MKELLQLQSDADTERAKFNAKINELTVALDRAKSHLSDKDQTISDLKSSRPLVSVYFSTYGTLIIVSHKHSFKLFLKVTLSSETIILDYIMPC